MKIPRLKERIENMLFRATFWERYQQLHQQMTAVFDASLSLKHARNFKKLLHVSIQGGYVKIDSSTNLSFCNSLFCFLETF
jgi:hypothetical protein